ncbi:flavin reductase [Anoxybacter fermentans]|uniref:Flavin reductase n=1 Tax=Anoxybacter fermentans TaxID=1323375 RepID=A0A3Q9HPD8_9FIRM|nr:flavin reductase family protein [Anoxybacter fermentans]AZR72456.1 flavin reductase [Anoxybacter fermentans]
MSKKLLKPTTALAPVPVVLVSCCNEAGESNIITIAWVGTLCSEPPLIGIGIRKSRFSYDMIKETGEFVVNLPSENLVWTTDFCGINSGRNVDKFGELELTPVPGEKVNAPLIGECPVNIECKVTKILELGSHDLFIGEVVAVHAEDDVLDENGRFCMEKAGLIAYGSGNYWSLGRSLGSAGFSKKK